MEVSLWGFHLHILKFIYIIECWFQDVCLEGHHSQILCEEPQEFTCSSASGLWYLLERGPNFFKSIALVPEVCTHVNLFLKGIFCYIINKDKKYLFNLTLWSESSNLIFVFHTILFLYFPTTDWAIIWNMIWIFLSCWQIESSYSERK